MALTLNLAAIPVKFVAIPVLAALTAATGAVAAYVTTPTSSLTASANTLAALPIPASAPVATDEAKSERPSAKPSCTLQTWPYLDNRCIARGSEPARQVRLVTASRSADVAAPSLVTSDTVLRGPGVAPETSAPAVKKQRSATRRTRIVVHPLRFNSYSSRF